MAKRRKKADPERHSRRCAICRHRDRRAIERAIVEWQATAKVAKDFGVRRQALILHTDAMDLLIERNRNVKPYLLRIVEASTAQFRKASLRDGLAAATVITKLDADGRWEDRSRVQVDHYLPEMTDLEIEEFIDREVLPERIRKQIEEESKKQGNVLGTPEVN